MSDNRKNINKREFIEYCTLGFGGCFLGLENIKSLAGNFNEKLSTQPSSDDLWN
jgi:hypothetical protein